MYNLSVQAGAGPGAPGALLAVEGSCSTPRTPEILNSLIAMTNPFDAFPGAASAAPGRAAAPSTRTRTRTSHAPALSPVGDSCSNSSCSSVPSSQGSTAGTPPLGSPTDASGGCSPPSVQHTRSQLIKEGLKLTIQSKRRHAGRGLDPDDVDGARAAKHARRDEFGVCGLPGCGELGHCCHLTAEDEERRRRRRERNKIAATKCRLKKRERTVNLVHESEILETQNHELKNQIQDLETQRRRLMEMLNMHSPTCLKNNGAASGPGNGSGPSQLSPTTPQAPLPGTPFCGTTSDINTPAHHHHHHQPNYCDPYHSYGSVSCSFGGGYAASGGVDNGCMA